MKFLKFMGVFVLTIVLAIVLLWLWNQGILVSLTPTAFKYRALSEKYGGVYVFYPEFREEIKQRERERKEEDKKLLAIVNKKTDEKMKQDYGFTDEDIQKLNTPQEDYLKQKQYDEVWRGFYKQIYAGFDEKYPQTLSNGCKYHNQAFGPYDPNFESYYEKIKEFVGEKDYEKLKPSLVITSFYRCKDGKEFLITVYPYISFNYRIYGLFGDEGSGFSFSSVETFSTGGKNTFELRNGKFEKVDKEYEGWD